MPTSLARRSSSCWKICAISVAGTASRKRTKTTWRIIAFEPQSRSVPPSYSGDAPPSMQLPKGTVTQSSSRRLDCMTAYRNSNVVPVFLASAASKDARYSIYARHKPSCLIIDEEVVGGNSRRCRKPSLSGRETASSCNVRGEASERRFNRLESRPFRHCIPSHILATGLTDSKVTRVPSFVRFRTV